MSVKRRTSKTEDLHKDSFFIRESPFMSFNLLNAIQEMSQELQECDVRREGLVKVTPKVNCELDWVEVHSLD